MEVKAVIGVTTLLMVVRLDGLQFMGRAISFDLPPFRETLDLQAEEKTPDAERIQFKFVAFGKRWSVDATRNNLLFTRKSRITLRDTRGKILKHHKPQSNCYYVGTAKGDDSEYGMASLSTCGEEIHGLVVTNINDYVIYEKGWKHSRRKRSISERSITMKIANSTKSGQDFQAYLIKKLKNTWETSNGTSKRRVTRQAENVETPKFYRLDPPGGRNVYVELAVILDKHYMADFKQMVSSSTEHLLQHVLLSFNNAQLWYIHPTLGFNVWLVLRDIVLIDDDLPLVRDAAALSNPAALCNWVKRSFTENSTWDEIMILSSKRDIWHGRVGLAQRAGVCSVHGNDRCAGVSHVNFQMASLARLIAHEAMHPLGVGDDYEGRNSKLCYSGIMRRGVWQDHDWSVCAVQSFERWISAKLSDCVSRTQTPALNEKTTPPHIPVNIGWRANAVQSTTYKSEKEWGAWKATDGPITGVPANGNALYGSCTHTLREDKPWIRIDLENVYSKRHIEEIVIFNRDDCCGDRLRNFEVRIGSYSNFRRNPLCFHHKKGVAGGRNGATVISCKSPLAGKYVSVQLMGRNAILTVCEIQILSRVSLNDYTYRENQCHDIDGFCSYWEDVGECTRTGQVNFMRKNCEYSCGVCRRRSYKPTDDKAPYDDVILPVTAPPGNSCQDTHDSCMHYAANGDCEIDKDTKNRCPRSCRVCGNTEPPENVIRYTTKSIKNITPTTTRGQRPITSSKTSTASPTTVIMEEISTQRASEKYRPTGDNGNNKEKDMLVGDRISPPAFNAATSTVAPDIDAKLKSKHLPEKKGEPQEPAVAACTDGSVHCESWVRMGYCATSVVVSRLCQKSCNQCEDILTSCQQCTGDQTQCKNCTVFKNNSILESAATTYSPGSSRSESATISHRTSNIASTSASTSTSTSASTTASTSTSASTTSASTSTMNTVKDRLLRSSCADELPAATCKELFDSRRCSSETASPCRKTCGICKLEIDSSSEESQVTEQTSQPTSSEKKQTGSFRNSDVRSGRDHGEDSTDVRTIKPAITTSKSVMAASSGNKYTSVSSRVITQTAMAEPSTTQITTTEPSTTQTMTTQPSTTQTTMVVRCVDLRKACKSWAKSGHCSNASVKKTCSLSCQTCEEAKEVEQDVQCADTLAACSSWAQSGYCNRKSVANLCNRTCKVC